MIATPIEWAPLANAALSDIQHYQSGIKALEAYACKAFLRLLSESGFFLDYGDVCELNQIIERMQIDHQYIPLLNEFLHIMCCNDLLVQISDGLYECLCSPYDELDGLEECYAQLSNQYPSVRAQAVHVISVMELMADLLTKKADVLSLLFPGGSCAIVSDLYCKGLDTAYYNEAVAGFVYNYLQQSDQTKCVKILEVGAGIGSTTQHIMNRCLAEYQHAIDYTYTDVSRFFLNYAQEKYSGKNRFKFDILDLNKSPQKQGFDNKYDLVIATNVLHATEDLDQTLKHVASVLAKGGYLIMHEGIAKKEYSTWAFGLIEGWWHCRDVNRRIQGSPFATYATWQAILKKHQFQHISSFNEYAQPDLELFQDVIVAQKI